MSDIFTLKTIPVTAELGMALKNFRISHERTAKTVTEHFSKASSYITKLEKGEIKKIDSFFFIELCDFITQTNTGLISFLSQAAKNYLEYSLETKLIIKNIDELLVEHIVSKSFISDINAYIEKQNISLHDLVNKINSNEDIINYYQFKNAPLNEWCNYSAEDDTNRSFIKLNVPIWYVEDLVNGKIVTIHYVIAEAILYALYRLGNEENAQIFANSKLHIHQIVNYIGSNIVEVSDSNIENLFGGLDPEISNTLQSITQALKVVTFLTKENGYASKHIKQLEANLSSDLGFAFAYMSLNLEGISGKDKSEKSAFFKELKLLIDKFSKNNSNIDIYE